MTDHAENPPGGPQPTGEPGQFTQQFRHQQVTARVPEHVARGVFSTGVLILQGGQEFLLDFILAISRPHQIVARVVMPPAVVHSFIGALKTNLENYKAKFGEPMQLPKPPPNVKPPSVEEIYEQLKLPDDIASGMYANNVMITHSPAEFCFDFITSFYPRSAVAARVHLSVPQVPRMLETLTRSMEQFHKRIASMQQPPRPPDSITTMPEPGQAPPPRFEQLNLPDNPPGPTEPPEIPPPGPPLGPEDSGPGFDSPGKS